MNKPELPISEIFHSIQGEGKLMGTPSAFVRLSGCNLRCVWCDTPFASHRPEFTKMSVNQIADQILAMNCSHVVLTGGEPAIFPKCSPLCQILKEAKKHITLETAGTVFVDFPVDLVSISPKLSNSLPFGDPHCADHEVKRLNTPVLQKFIKHKETQFKFVLQNPGDIVEVEQVLENLLGWGPDEIFLMPEGRDHETLRQRGLWIVELCKRTGYRYCPRLQVELWGDQRGV